MADAVNKKISELPDAGALSGSEEFPIVQGGVTKRVTINEALNSTITKTNSTATSNTALEIATLSVTKTAGIQWAINLRITGQSANEFSYSEALVIKDTGLDSVTINEKGGDMASDTDKLDRPTITYSDRTITVTQRAVSTDDGATQWGLEAILLRKDSTASIAFD